MTPSEAKISVEELKALFSYKDGVLYHNKNHQNTRVGDSVGRVDDGKYLRTSINGNRVFVHRIVFALFNNRWPTEFIDHKDGNKLNNSIENLRECSARQNQYNKTIGGSSVKGVYFDKSKGRWAARIRLPCGKRVRLGTHQTKEQAYEAYKRKAELFQKEFMYQI